MSRKQQIKNADTLFPGYGARVAQVGAKEKHSKNVYNSRDKIYLILKIKKNKKKLKKKIKKCVRLPKKKFGKSRKKYNARTAPWARGDERKNKINRLVYVVMYYLLICYITLCLYYHDGED